MEIYCAQKCLRETKKLRCCHFSKTDTYNTALKNWKMTIKMFYWKTSGSPGKLHGFATSITAKLFDTQNLQRL